ncbi:MAG: S41 family peptidase, partial [Acidimicrobiia bacterium]
AGIGSFRCAIPEPAFETTCHSLAQRVATGGVTMAEGVEAAVASMIKLSLDPFTYYIPPELSGALSDEGVVAAVGLLVTITDPVGSACTVVQPPCRLEVALVAEDGPAHEAGLTPGMVITAIDGETVVGDGLVDIAARLDGPSGTTVTVDVETAEGDSATLTLLRGDVPIPTLDVELPRPDVGYIRIPSFQAGIPTFVHQALAQLQARSPGRIVIDLRDNPGGYVDEATSVASEFLPDGLVFRSRGRDGETDYPVQPGGLATSGVDLTVVVNSGSASAAEILAAALQERGRATVVGTHTFGKNTVQIAFRLPNDGELRVTIARWTTPEGESVAITGLEPDTQVDIPLDATAAEVVDLALGAS